MASRAGEVLVRIVGEIRGFKDKLNEAAKDAENFGKRARSSITKAFSDITSIVTSRFGRMGAEAQKSLDGIAAKAAASGSGLALGVGAGAAIAAAGIASLAAKGVRSFVSLTAEVRNFQRLSGATAEDASRMVAAFKLLGVDAQTGARGLFMLAKNVENSKDKIEEAGITIARNRNGSVDLLQTLLNVGDAYKAAGGGAEGAAIAAAAFGRSGAALLPVLASSRDRIEEFWKAAEAHGEIFHADDLEKGREFQIAMRELDAAVGGLERALGEGLVPALTEVADVVTAVVDKVNWFAKAVGGVKNVVKSFIDFAIPGAEAFRFFHHTAKDAGEAATDTAGAIDDLTGSLDENTTAADEATSRLKDYKDALDGIKNSALGVSDAEDAVTSDLLDLQDKADSAAKSRADATKRYADAVESANKRIRDAEEDVAKAREDLNDLNTREGRPEARDRLRDAEERLADTRSDSAKSIRDAKENLDDWTPSLDRSTRAGIENRKVFDGIVDDVETVVTRMVEQKRPASEIIGFLESQRTKLEDIGTKLGFNKQQLQEYLDLLSQFETGPLPSIPSGGALGNGTPGSGLAAIVSGMGPVINNYYYAPVNATGDFAKRQAKENAWQLRRRG